MSVPAVLILKTTKQIIKEDVYPREDMQPVQGLPPEYEWFVKHIPFAEPPYDSRVFMMQTDLPDLDQLALWEEHPNYEGIRAYKIGYTPIKRENIDIIRSIENAEKEANDGVFSEAVHKDQMAFMLNSVHKDAKGQALTVDEQDQIDKLAIVTVNLAKNKDEAANKIAQVEAGQTPNISEGWQNSL
jgi:hypothetical protein